MGKPSIFITRRWPEVVEKRLSSLYDVTLNTNDVPLDAAGMRDVIARFDAVLPTVTDKLGAEALDVGKPQAKIFGNYGVGYSHICEQSARKLGVTVTNTPYVLSECTADLAMTLMLMVARRAGEGERELRAGAWSGWRPTHMVGSKISGKTLGIIGFGRIGQEMAQRARYGFGMDIIVLSRSKVAAEILTRLNAVQVETLDELLPKCDFVSLHCPGGDANRHLINAQSLDKFKPGAFLINTARGEVVDESALASALKAGRMGGAGLDVFENEPRVSPELLSCENLVILPHLGSATRETREAMGFRVLDNLSDFFAGKEPRDRVI